MAKRHVRGVRTRSSEPAEVRLPAVVDSDSGQPRLEFASTKLGVSAAAWSAAYVDDEVYCCSSEQFGKPFLAHRAVPDGEQVRFDRGHETVDLVTTERVGRLRPQAIGALHWFRLTQKCSLTKELPTRQVSASTAKSRSTPTASRKMSAAGSRNAVARKAGPSKKLAAVKNAVSGTKTRWVDSHVGRCWRAGCASIAIKECVHAREDVVEIDRRVRGQCGEHKVVLLGSMQAEHGGERLGGTHGAGAIRRSFDEEGGRP